LTELIDEIEGKSGYVDGLDGLSFVKEIQQYLIVEQKGEKMEHKVGTEFLYHMLTADEVVASRTQRGYKPMFSWPKG